MDSWILLESSEPDGPLTLPAITSLFPRDKREAMEALKELLRDKGVPSSANWESALKMIQKDARWVTFAKLILIPILTGFTKFSQHRSPVRKGIIEVLETSDWL